MLSRLFAFDPKTPLPARIRQALAQAPGAVAVGVRADEDAPGDVDGVPVGVSTSGLVLQPGWVELVEEYDARA